MIYLTSLTKLHCFNLINVFPLNMCESQKWWYIHDLLMYLTILQNFNLIR